MNIDEWMKIHRANFGSDFETEFAIRVLSKIRSIDLNTVSTQYHFKDLDEKDRYVDFIIREGSIKIAIEIDGFSKVPGQLGMSHDEFVDWQRRQAALTSHGWHVLRFANRDVINEPGRCQRYIELLLQDQRSKIRHQTNLEESIDHLNSKLNALSGASTYSDHADKLQREIAVLEKQLALAQNTQPLDSGDKNELEQLISQLEQEKKELIAAHEKTKEERDNLAESNAKLKTQKQFLDRENNTMKTTVWAFVVVLGFFVMAGAYVFKNNINTQTNTPIIEKSIQPLGQEEKPHLTPQATETVGLPAHTESAATKKPHIATKATGPVDQQSHVESAATKKSHLAAKATESVDLQPRVENTAISATSCESPIDWHLAKNYIDQLVAVRGTVMEYRYLSTEKGAPTWINIGAKYPVKDRLTVVIWGNNRNKFGRALSEELVNREICIIGRIGMRDGIPQVTLKWPRELIFQ